MQATMKKMVIAVALSVCAVSAHASAIHDAGLFATNTLAANDDGSTGSVAMGFGINFYGNSFNSLFVNNNGNVTFNSPMTTYTPFSILSTSTPMLAPFFADVDTRGAGSSEVQYGQSTIGGHNVFGVNWVNVGYYNAQTDKLNSFQLIITDRSDVGAGDFDFEFNYDQINWETGSASSGTNGFGGSSARAGWSNGTTTSYEIAGSAVNGALLDSNAASGLVHNAINSNVNGRYVFSVRNGLVEEVPPPAPAPVPVPAAAWLLGSGLLGLIGVSRRRQG